MERLALPADDPRIGRHRSCEVYLVFERHGGKAWLERSYDGCWHTGIEQDGRVTTMDESQGIVVLCRRYRGQHDEPRLGSLDVDIEKLEHCRMRNGTLHERSEVLKTRESGNALVCGRIHALSLSISSCSIITVFGCTRTRGVCLVFLSRFGSMARTLIERCEYISLNVLQNFVRKRWLSLRGRS